MTLPVRAGRGEALSFLSTQEQWLRGVLAARPGRTSIEDGAVVPVEGRAYRVVLARTRSVEFRGGDLIVPCDRPGPRLAGHLKQAAMLRLTEAVNRTARPLGRKPATLAIRDTRSRWGSCSSEGRLMLSWRLILAPPAVFDYVVTHEMAHLVHMDHSPRFWALVERLDPHAGAARRWLRRYGAELHRYDFAG